MMGGGLGLAGEVTRIWLLPPSRNHLLALWRNRWGQSGVNGMSLMHSKAMSTPSVGGAEIQQCSARSAALVVPTKQQQQPLGSGDAVRSPSLGLTGGGGGA